MSTEPLNPTPLPFDSASPDVESASPSQADLLRPLSDRPLCVRGLLRCIQVFTCEVNADAEEATYREQPRTAEERIAAEDARVHRLLKRRALWEATLNLAFFVLTIVQLVQGVSHINDECHHPLPQWLFAGSCLSLVASLLFFTMTTRRMLNGTTGHDPNPGLTQACRRASALIGILFIAYLVLGMVWVYSPRGIDCDADAFHSAQVCLWVSYGFFAWYTLLETWLNCRMHVRTRRHARWRARHAIGLNPDGSPMMGTSLNFALGSPLAPKSVPDMMYQSAPDEAA